MEFLGLRYSAKEKWNLDFNQFLLVHAGSELGLPLFPNHIGFGSETYSLLLGMTLMLLLESSAILVLLAACCLFILLVDFVG